MSIRITTYTQDWTSAVRDFNFRIRAAGDSEELRFPESHIPDWLPKREGFDMFQEYLLAVEDGSVRGGFILKRQKFSFGGETRTVAHYRLPLSEGLCNKAYAVVGAQMLLEALKAEPLLFALGMGGLDRPLPRMLKAMGWSMCHVPFYFRVNHAVAFLREIRALRTSRLRRAALNAAAFSGLGPLAIHALQFSATKRNPAPQAFTAQPIRGFGSWADELWERCKGEYALCAVRDAAVLNALYPASSERFICIKCSSGNRVAGWAVVLDTRMSDHRQFGNLRVGTLADCLALPEDAPGVVAAAVSILKSRGVDLIVSNQSHAAWTRALEQAGFREGPSNFIFAASKKMSQSLHPFESRRTHIHINRGDGDGPIHL